MDLFIRGLEEVLDTMRFKDINIETFYHGEKMFMIEDASLYFLETRK